ncbi:hypothetical protein R50076_06370 [Gilvimarinus japonicus]|jgi:hypothetical protein
MPIPVTTTRFIGYLLIVLSLSKSGYIFVYYATVGPFTTDSTVVAGLSALLLKGIGV